MALVLSLVKLNSGSTMTGVCSEELLILWFNDSGWGMFGSVEGKAQARLYKMLDSAHASPRC